MPLPLLHQCRSVRKQSLVLPRDCQGPPSGESVAVNFSVRGFAARLGVVPGAIARLGFVTAALHRWLPDPACSGWLGPARCCNVLLAETHYGAGARQGHRSKALVAFDRGRARAARCESRVRIAYERAWPRARSHRGTAQTRTAPLARPLASLVVRVRSIFVRTDVFNLDGDGRAIDADLVVLLKKLQDAIER